MKVSLKMFMQEFNDFLDSPNIHNNSMMVCISFCIVKLVILKDTKYCWLQVFMEHGAAVGMVGSFTL